MVYNSPLGKTKFPLAPVSDGCTFISGYAFKSKDFTDIGYPVIKIKNIHDGFVTLEDSHCVTSKTVEGLKKFRLNNGDVLIAMTGQGSVGRVGRLSFNGDKAPYLNQRVGKFIADEKKLNISYLYYILTTKQYQNILFNNASGSGQPNLSPAVIQSILIPYPEYHLQCKMAKILDEINDRIIKNNAINNTLEQMSQTLFKSWFVDFDPVIDNALDAGNPIPEALQSRAELRQKVRNSADFKPLPADIRALFPAEFEEMELGWIPKGWKEIKLSLLSKITSGKRPPSKFSEPSSINNVPVWGGNGIKWFTSEHLYNERYIITGRVGTLGTFYKVNGLSWPSDNALVIQPVNHELYELIYQSLQTKDILSLNVGSTQPLLTQTTLGNITFIIPLDRGLLVKFQSICDSFQEKISDNKINIEINTTLRDTLLPKLISGELSLEDLPDLVTQTEPA
ncbi:TPA: restriction endonuclease subunit S [Klebsiella quasipneumoniae subsp. quasipneumoniae]|uniref:restriction endonuclease subunit S n=1 Tax=Klebsiella quasipneumoniae TaxID=1463165 RepID=UPI000E2B12B8|nr:restriction endonuclease subunit S [Klebsiella quasipneumoniae]SXD38302.1 restriction modification system DNA specificity domain-containing protein [Klebsiella quasipneumoniae]HBR1994204.1 restriction endonuclease subunit S [Klebsiella quasipneumoniae subsp. similipneumoniae]HBR1995619.1 restriction endonuclease subunit S [Klebsiella quasipneumoniae subsp. similipneumoniae]HCI6811599.1 restriction endonuclease subunit S [Klebsiella quasipneumoniae subsp. quasipneumoniae]